MFDQTLAPKEGELKAIINTNMGTVKVRLFPEYAPKAVENFTTLAKNGYYDGTIFHRVIKDFMIQGGDPTGTGRGGESIWGDKFEDEFTSELHNYRGALSMANAGPCTNGSQFFIVQLCDCDYSMLQQMKALPNEFPAECVEKYEQLGGTPWLDYHHTVFGHVYEGMDVVDAIAGVEVGFADKPKNDVKILSIDIEE
ncbi:MAG: peptidylprolyl isomerase [Clostridia bacterium]|nr:peptidylprolyl isomerase [Clostridia bacterium]MBQ1895784.1 peptidylprolyl isomerase [Clostridia bacterium]MBQ2499899.1 peptidylprolyl isomerase [Clostridia bacterium]MBQ3898180.1 peptidylprolyl isomerase [Clostridia bacterium]